MLYHNADLSLDQFFLHRDDRTVHQLQDLLGEPLDRNIYFRPGSSPIVDRDDYHSGSCFRDYLVPTAAFAYDQHGTQYQITKDLDLATYRQELYENIQRRIKKIYLEHEYVTLAFSGGVDSTVLLSFVAQADLLPRTDVICHKNTTQTDPSCLHKNDHKIDCVNQILDSVRHRLRSVTWTELTLEEPLRFFNQGDLPHLKCYASAAMLQRSPNTACMFGHHGNQVLLHKWIFWDDMIHHDPAARYHIQQFLSSHDQFYADSLKKYDIKGAKISIDRRHHLQKPWALLDGFCGKKIYAPLADEHDLANLRRLDSLDIPVSMIANAELAREFIDRNVAQDWNQWVTTESLSDGDSLCSMMLPIDRVDPKLFVIPLNLNHDAEGLDWIQYEIETAKQTGHIAINSLVSIKNLQWLSGLHK